VFVRPCTDNCRPVRRLAEQIQVDFPPQLVRRGRHPMFRARQGNFFPCSMGSAVKSRWWPSSRSLRHVQFCQLRERDYRSCTDMRRRRRRGKEERYGGTKKPTKKQLCQLKPLFQLQKAAFFFVIPLVISADIRTQKMWVSG